MAERTNEEKLDLFADLMEPVATILGDEEVRDSFTKSTPPIRIAALAIKKHKQEVIAILARLDGVPVSEYKVNLISIPIKLVRLLNTPEAKELFTGAELKNEAASSGSATETIEDGAI